METQTLFSSAGYQRTADDPERSIMLNSLPVEILIAIFTHLRDFRSVRSLALTSWVFYRTLPKAESAIVREVFLNEIEFLSEAIAVVRSLRLTSWDVSSVKGVLDTYFDKELKLDDIVWNMGLGMQIHTFHRLVKSFSEDFALSALK